MGKGGGGVKISAPVSAYLGFKPNYFLNTDLQVGRGGGQNRSLCLAILDLKTSLQNISQ